MSTWYTSIQEESQNDEETEIQEEPQKDEETESQSIYHGNTSGDETDGITQRDSTFYVPLDHNEGDDGVRTRRKESAECPCRPVSEHPQPSMWHTACTHSLAKERLGRNKSEIWDLDGMFDTYRTFQVAHEKCVDLKVTVHRGENITKGSWFKDAVDTPDPYIVLRIPQLKINTLKRTSTEEDSTNPRWDQTFHFYLYKSPRKPYVMEISLMEENVIKDETIETQSFSLDCLEEGIPKDCIFTFKGNSKVYMTFLKQKNEQTDLRFSMSLCDEEKAYLRQRRTKVFKSMISLFGDDGPNTESEVPTIGILGSGGGFRAMIGLSGALHALQDSGILDCVTYLAGLSGSTWCISTLYSQNLLCDIPCKENKKEYSEEVKLTYVRKGNHNDNDYSSIANKSIRGLKSTNIFHGSLNVKEFQESLCKSVGKKWEWNILKMPQHVVDMLSKYWKGQSMSHITLVDIFGHLIGDVLLGKEKKNLMKLSDLQARVSEGEAPFPLFAGLHATKRASDEFSEWIEFSPYEIGLGKYGTFMKTEDFGSKFFAGKLLKKCNEMPLHYLQGMWGSAFTINLKRHLIGVTNIITEDTDEFTDEMRCINDDEDSDIDIDSDDSEDEVEDSSGTRSYLKRRKQSADKGIRKSSLEEYKKKNWFVSALEKVGIDSSRLLNTRPVKPGRIYNPFRGVSLNYAFVKDQIDQERDAANFTEGESIKYADGCKFKPVSHESKKISVMDSGFAMNSPYPLLLRPQRGVDIFLSFDFSNRNEDLTVDESTFKQLVKAEEWAKERYIPFPPVKERIDEYLGTEIQECYVFESSIDSRIPVILHFSLVNNKFRKYKTPEVLRSSDEELDFAKFPCFGKDSEFSTFKFHYDSKEFDRLAKLMEYNTLLCKETILQTIKNSIIKKKQGRKLDIYEIAKILLWHKNNEKED
ncbi:unnamed protein product [Meganyctiphanes norvegica]|uniref:Phospholipase A2 n=1 Tax=Meganyctiphanes norvegica TaxID=48144 RepID=A0AAV2Q379_MEGNR